MAWSLKFKQDNPSIAMARFTTARSGNLMGHSCHFEGRYRTSTGRPIACDFRYHNRPFEEVGQLVLSAEGRSMTVPLEDVVSGRAIDLKAEFPEAFR